MPMSKLSDGKRISIHNEDVPGHGRNSFCSAYNSETPIQFAEGVEVPAGCIAILRVSQMHIGSLYICLSPDAAEELISQLKECTLYARANVEEEASKGTDINTLMSPAQIRRYIK